MIQDFESIARHLYEVYCAAVGGVAFNGDPLPDWETFRKDPSKKTQANAWIVAARASYADALSSLLEPDGLSILYDRCVALGVSSENLDDLVWQCAENLASDVNNEGLKGQLTFILRHSNPKEVEQYLKEQS